MIKNVICDAKTALGIFKDMQQERKKGNEVTVQKKIAIPYISVGAGFYNTVEGCTLSWCGEDIVARSYKAFNSLPNEEKQRLIFSPKDGEFVERAKFWKNLLKSVMTEKQCHIAMNHIIHWYIHIKQMQFEKGGSKCQSE